MRRRRVKLVKWLAAVALAAGCGTMFSWHVGHIGGNVHTVSEGKAYRSAQLFDSTLEDVLRRHRIRTVVSVRGGLPGEERFDAEVATAAKCGAKVISVPMSARELPPPATLRRLMRVFDQAPRPLLIHCAGGADRSGFASALYRILEEGASVDRAQDEELTWQYGHFSFGMAQAMDQFFDLYRATSGGLPMRRWISDDYPRIYSELVEGGVVHAIRNR